MPRSASPQSKIARLVLKTSKLLRSDITPENLAVKRANYAKLEKYFPVSRTVKIRPENIDGLKAEWITVPTSRPDTIMLYMHGGGFVLDSTRLHRDLISRIAAAGHVTALSLGYSLAPEHPFPTALHETMRAYKWLLAKKFDPKHIILAGDSAGGSLVLSALHTIRDEKLPFPACAVVIAPATDAMPDNAAIAFQNRAKDFFIKRENLDFFIDAYFQKTPHNHPIASPLHGSLKDFPPLLVHASKNELMYSDSARLVEKAKREGVHVEFYEGENLWHVWHLFARYLPEARDAIRNIGEFIDTNVRYT